MAENRKVERRGRKKQIKDSVIQNFKTERAEKKEYVDLCKKHGIGVACDLRDLVKKRIEQLKLK